MSDVISFRRLRSFPFCPGRRNVRATFCVLLWGFFAIVLNITGATLTMKTNRLGSTPEILAYNSGHFYSGSNTKDWWRYSGVSGVRFFVAPGEIEATDDIPARGDGVITQTDFVNRKAALRANPLSASYINWPYFTNRYETRTFSGNIFKVNHAFSEARALGLNILVNISATLGSFTIEDQDDWAGKWELWQHYYAQAFYLSRQFDVERFQMFNEPNHSSAGGITPEQYLVRLQLASDAIQSALVDVNLLYGKSLKPTILAPVITTSSYVDWSAAVVTNRHLNYLGQVDTSFSLIHKYDYHQYNSAPSGFGNNLNSLRQALASAMSPEPPLPLTITEFNVHTAANFAAMSETLDTPSKYSRFGGIASQLLKNFCSEMYCFKFSQTEDGDGVVKKNGMHYVDNDNAPYNVGTITRAGEVWRLFNKAFAPDRDLLDLTIGTGTDGLEMAASRDAAAKKYYLFSANETALPVSLSINLSAWNIPSSNTVIIEEVSENSYGGVKWLTNLSQGPIIAVAQPANTVWLLSVSSQPQESGITINASHDTMVSDGLNKAVNYGGNIVCHVRNNSTNAAGRYASLIKFSLPTMNVANLQSAFLTVRASSIHGADSVWAHVYGITNNGWNQNFIGWINAPNLAQNISPGTDYTNNFLLGAGTSAEIVGQMVANSTAADRTIDVTDYLRNHPGTNASFLLVRPVGFRGDQHDDDGFSFTSKEGSATNGPRLCLVMASTNVAANNFPSAVDDYAFTTQPAAVVIPVLTNDSDPDGDALSIQSFAQGINGAVSSNGSGELVYTPNASFYGADEFLYTIHDGRGGSVSASVHVTVYSSSGKQLISANVINKSEANIKGGSSANSDVDEAAVNYVILKYYTPPFELARKAYFQFDLSQFDLNTNQSASFRLNVNANACRVQLWGLNQDYPEFHSAITWNNAQANDTASNQLLTNGAYTATPIGDSVMLPGAGSYNFLLPRLGDFLFNGRVTLALTPVDDPANNSGGLRIQRTNAWLTFSANVPAPVPPSHRIAGIGRNLNGTIALQFSGAPNQIYRIQAASDFALNNWTNIGTNIASADGTWNFTDFHSTNYPARFYRSVTP